MERGVRDIVRIPHAGFEFDEARLDCVETEPLIAGWRAGISEAPDAQPEALTTDLFEQLSATLSACAEAETMGDYRDVGMGLDDAMSSMARIENRVSEIYAGS